MRLKRLRVLSNPPTPHDWFLSHNEWKCHNFGHSIRWQTGCAYRFHWMTQFVLLCSAATKMRFSSTWPKKMQEWLFTNWRLSACVCLFFEARVWLSMFPVIIHLLNCCFTCFGVARVECIIEYRARNLNASSVTATYQWTGCWHMCNNSVEKLSPLNIIQEATAIALKLVGHSKWEQKKNSAGTRLPWFFKPL